MLPLLSRVDTLLFYEILKAGEEGCFVKEIRLKTNIDESGAYKRISVLKKRGLISKVPLRKNKRLFKFCLAPTLMKHRDAIMEIYNEIGFSE